MFEHNWNGQELTQKFSGDITSAEIKQSFSQIHADPRFGELQFVILDFLDCTRIDNHEATIAEIAALNAAAALINPSIKLAVITKDLDVLNFVKTYLSCNLNEYIVRIFDAVYKAKAWFFIFQPDQN